MLTCLKCHNTTSKVYCNFYMSHKTRCDFTPMPRLTRLKLQAQALDRDPSLWLDPARVSPKDLAAE